MPPFRSGPIATCARGTILSLGALLLWTVASPADGTAQVVSGVVREGTDQAPIEGVLVSQVVEGETRASTLTDASGRFELELREPVASHLRFERMGYRPHERPVPDASTSAALEVELAPDPFLLSGVEVDVEREPEQFRLSSYFTWTEEGLYRTNAMHRGCHLMVLDSVVIRDPDLYRPEVIEEYWPASHFMDTDWGPRASYNQLGWPNVAGLAENEPRLEYEADPCTPAVFIPGQDPFYDRVRPRRTRPEPYPDRPLPEPAAPAFTLVAGAEVAVAGSGAVDDPTEKLPAAIGPDGTLALADPHETVVRVLDSGGRELEAWALDEPPASFGAVSHIGWSADTLWAADAGRGRVAFLPSGADRPLVREPRAPELVPGEVEGAPYQGEDPDLEVPIPLAVGRWLSVQLAGPELYPTRLEDEPARRALIVLDPQHRLERVLETLRPGPWRIDVKEAGAPVDPFRDHPLYAVSPDGAHVTVVERSLQHAVWMDIYTVTRLTPEGDTLFRVERQPPLISLSEETRAAAAEELADHPVLAEALPFDDARPALVEGLMYDAPFHPPISDVVVGRDGTTWLRWPDAGDGRVRWDVLDPEGRPLRTLALDRRLRIVGATADAAWGLVRGGGGELRAVRFEIERR